MSVTNKKFKVKNGLDASGDITTSGSFSGSGANLTSIPNSALNNSSITINGTQVSLGSSIEVSGGGGGSSETFSPFFLMGV